MLMYAYLYAVMGGLDIIFLAQDRYIFTSDTNSDDHHSLFITDDFAITIPMIISYHTDHF